MGKIVAGVVRMLLLCGLLLALPSLAGAQCTYLYTSTSAPTSFPAGFGVPWNVFDPTQILLKASCTSASATVVNVGPGSNTLITYNQGYQWNAAKNQWDSFPFSCDAALVNGSWCPGNATATLISSSPYIAYTCNWTGTQWQCGCRDKTCAENLWQVQEILPVSGTPQGKASNLVVLVHGCCTDENGVQEWRDGMGGEIIRKLRQNKTSDKWEVVVWDWNGDTPTLPRIDCPSIFSCAYDHAESQAKKLAPAIWSHSYQYIHVIGHSAGARLIHFTATDLISNSTIQKDKPFIHLTFLDAFTFTDEDSGKKGGQGYGYLKDYQDHSYAEHYVTTCCLTGTDALLTSAFNFDIKDWDHPFDLNDPGAHQWPRQWYTRSVESPNRTGELGFKLSLEGGDQAYSTLSQSFKPGYSCNLIDVNSTVLCSFLSSAR